MVDHLVPPPMQALNGLKGPEQLHHEPSTQPRSYKQAKIASTIGHLPGRLPHQPLLKSVDPSEVAQAMVAALNKGVTADLFTADAFWRDQFTLTHNLRTFYTPEKILAAWQSRATDFKPASFELVQGSAMCYPTWVTAVFNFQTGGALAANNSGILYIVPVDETCTDWKIWLFLTYLEDFTQNKGKDLRTLDEEFLQAHKDHLPIQGEANGSTDSASTAAHDKYDAIIIGGGQAGLSTAGWCKSYGLRYVVIERNDEIGQNWTRRYDSAKLHTGHRFNDLPFGPTFTDEDPEWLTTGALAQGYRKYVKRFGINVWTSTTLVEPAKFDSDSQRWTVRVQRDGKEYTLSGRALVLGNGLGGAVPEKPDYPGEDDYQGVSIHSGLYRNSNAFAGKKGIVVGSANTGHDVAEDMLKAQLGEITMVQRGATYVVPREHFKVLFDQIWNNQIPQELSDRFFWSTPTGVSRLMTNAWFHPLAAAEPERWEALEKSGFNVDIQGDFVDHLLVRFGGHYMDCGVSKEIADGHIKVKSNSPIRRYTQSGLEFADGTTIDADLIVWCTGFKKEISQSVVPVLGEETAKRLKTYWGVDNQGEVNGAFVPSGVENCWLVGGGCSHARYFTRFVALQIQADKLGHPMTALYD